MPGSHLSWCSLVPSCSTAEPKRPHCTPDLICRLGSATTSSSKPAMLAPLFPSPPYSAGKARCTPPCSTSRCSWVSTRSRCSSMPRPSTRWNAGSLSISRASRRVSAHVPSRSSFTRVDVDAGVGCLLRRRGGGRCAAGGGALASGRLLGVGQRCRSWGSSHRRGERESASDGRSSTTLSQGAWSYPTSASTAGTHCCTAPTHGPPCASEQPDDTAVLVTSIVSAAGRSGRPGIVMTSPHTITTNSAPAARRTSRMSTEWPVGAPRSCGIGREGVLRLRHADRDSGRSRRPAAADLGAHRRGRRDVAGTVDAPGDRAHLLPERRLGGVDEPQLARLVAQPHDLARELLGPGAALGEVPGDDPPSRRGARRRRRAPRPRHPCPPRGD